MKYITLCAILITMAGCSIKTNSSFTIEQINECIAENQQIGLNESVEVCKNKCNDDVPCEQRVTVIAKEKFGYDVAQKYENNETQKQGDEDEVGEEETEQRENDEEIETLTMNAKQELKNKKIENGGAEDKINGEDEVDEEKIDIQESQDGLVSLSGFSCDNKENLPERMKVFAERVDTKKWHWVVPHFGVWELTELEPGEYKIYYASERNTEPLAKFSEFIANGSGSHDYKILDLTSGGEVRDIQPCDWE